MLSLQAVNRVLGNCSEFYEEQTRRLLDLGVDARSRAVTHARLVELIPPPHPDVYQRSLQDVCILEGRRFDGFSHVIE